ncbi:uncharacterized protein LOC126988321 [Eriocheir sinensis]|uniref:uncharacterized protein LOC126988321 n=1 Tax=Eriocheir sinensis TaxID=95602 RepID=UPI0021C824D2|nr:uncharacterized protein LOC126988321 [Eriocheir sinensis]
MTLVEVNITPLPLPLSTAKRLISRTCHSMWDDTLYDTLRTTSMGQYRTTSSPQPWRVLLRHQLRALVLPTFDLPTLLAAAGVHPSRQEPVIRLTCAFLRKTGQLRGLDDKEMLLPPASGYVSKVGATRLSTKHTGHFTQLLHTGYPRFNFISHNYYFFSPSLAPRDVVLAMLGGAQHQETAAQVRV